MGLLASSLFAQGLNTGGQTKDDWEEINFEFNSSILSDGYPSLLRLAELLSQHRDYRVKVTGHTDYVGSAAYNDKLALARAEAVKAFLVKYGVADDQVTTAGDGKRAPEVDNRTKEGRFMNRRVVLTRDRRERRARSRKAASATSSRRSMTSSTRWLKKQEECCAQILKRLDKLDDILAAMKNLQGENDKLRGRSRRSAQSAQRAAETRWPALPKPLTSSQTQDYRAHRSDRRGGRSAEAEQEVLHRGRQHRTDVRAVAHRRLQLQRARPVLLAVRRRRHARGPGAGRIHVLLGPPGRPVRHRSGQPLGQRAGRRFRQLQVPQLQGVSSPAADSVRRRSCWTTSSAAAASVLFTTKGFKNYAVLNSVQLDRRASLQTYARVVDQTGIKLLFGVWGNAYYGRQHRPTCAARRQATTVRAATIKLVQPFSEHVAFTAEVRLQRDACWAPRTADASCSASRSGTISTRRNTARPRRPVPMDVPRVRYELRRAAWATRAPVANAGPDQVGVTAGTVTLDGSGSYDPDGDPITYQWTQISGPAVTLATPTAAKTTFTAAAGQTYIFRLTVTDSGGLQSKRHHARHHAAPDGGPDRAVRRDPEPESRAGQQSTLTWLVQGATSVSISNGVGNVATTGSTTVSPTTTTTYTLTAVGPSGNVTATTTVTVGPTPAYGQSADPPLRSEPAEHHAGSAIDAELDHDGRDAGFDQRRRLGHAERQHHGVAGADHHLHVDRPPPPTARRVTAPITVTVASGTIPQVVVFVATPHHHRCRQLYQAVLAGDGRHGDQDRSWRGQQSQRERLRRRSARP